MSKQVTMTVFSFLELTDYLQHHIRDLMASKFLHMYMDDKLDHDTVLFRKIKEIVQDTTFQTIREGIKRLASEEVEEACIKQWYLDDGKIVAQYIDDGKIVTHLVKD